ncbi:MAG: hypothetical protein H0W61_08735 [Bacteroidetes bacterium]|nr:hypothetical protein [Bacteroidota bacterium]
MKSTVLLACCFVAIGGITAQTEDEKWNVGVHGGATQYSGDLGNGFYSNKQALYGFAGVSVSRYLTPRWDASLMITRGQAGYLASRDFSQDMSIDYNYRVDLSTANFVLRYNLRNRDYMFVPFVFAGGSLIRQRDRSTDLLNKKPFEFAVPTGGVGFIVQLNPTMAIQFQEMFIYTMSDNVDRHIGGRYNDSYLFHTLGLTFNLAKYKRVEGSRAGYRIDRCSDMGTGFKRKHDAKKVKAHSKHH